jgi:hypothetical protein
MTTYPKVLLYNNTLHPFDPHRIEYSNPRVTQHGGYVIQCKYKLDSGLLVPIILQTPILPTTFGANTQVEQDGKAKSSIDISFDGTLSPAMALFKKTIALWDTLVLQMAKDKKEVWFKQSTKITDEILDYLYIPMLRKTKRKDGSYFPECLKGKIKPNNCQVFNADRESIHVSDVTRGASVRVLLEQSGLWFNDKLFVSSFEAAQIQLVVATTLNGYGFVEEDTEMTSAN